MFALLAYGLYVIWRGAADDAVDSCGLFQCRAEARVHHAVDGVMHRLHPLNEGGNHLVTRHFFRPAQTSVFLSYFHRIRIRIQIQVYDIGIVKQFS